MDKLLYKMDEAAKILNIGTTKAYELVNSGQLPTIKLGRARRVTAEALTEFVRGKQEEAET